MDMDVDKDSKVAKEKEEKAMRKKKKDAAEDSDQINKVEKKKKNDKKKAEDNSEKSRNGEKGSAHKKEDGERVCTDMGVNKDSEVVKKMEEKAMRKKKIDTVEEGDQTNKVDKKKKKDKKEAEDNSEKSRNGEKGSAHKKEDGERVCTDMGVNKDSEVVKEMEEKALRKKKIDTVEESDQINKVEKKKKEDKKEAEDNSDDKSRNGEKGSAHKGMDVAEGPTDCTKVYPGSREDGIQFDGKEKKRKKDKRKAEVDPESNYDGIREKVSTRNDDNYENEREKKKKKKDKNNPELGSDTVTFGARNKDLNEAGDDYQNENKKKKKKERLEEMGGDQSNVKTKDVDKEKDCLQGDGCKVKEGKKKRRSKGEVKKSEDDFVSVPPVSLEEKDKEGLNMAKEGLIPQKSSKGNNDKKNTKKKLVTSRDDGAGISKDESAAVEADLKMHNADTNVSEKVEKKRKREKNESKDLNDGQVAKHSTRKRLKASEKEGSKMNKDKETKAVQSNSKDSTMEKKKKNKRVTFATHDEVFPGMIHGKRFSPEEDEIIKQAVLDYITNHDLGDEGLKMVMNCKSHSKVKNCWKEIGEALPNRPHAAVYDRAHTLFERDETRTWDEEDFEMLRRYYAEHGPKWKQIADAMGKHRRHVKDAWRRNKLTERKKGNWSQDEYQTLFNLVNVDLRAKVNEEKKSKHGMLRDNISWSAISDTLGSRPFALCCTKWYEQLTSSMVKEGEWADSDDYRLIDALYTLDACCIEDVDWDCLLEHRSGEICRKRWNQMANHIGENGKKSFTEQVEILSKRYCPELAEVRETWDSKPIVP